MNIVVFLLAIIFFSLGVFITSFTILSILIIIFFGIPHTITLERLGGLNKGNNIIRNYTISMLLLSTIFIVITYLVYRFSNASFIGYGIGIAVTLFVGRGKVGANQNNLSDYMSTNQRHFKIFPSE